MLVPAKFRDVLLALCFFNAKGIVFPASQDPGDKFTIVVNTFQRDECLRRVVKHYRTCGDVVDAIHVTWNEPGATARRRQPPEWLLAWASADPSAAASDGGPRVVIDYNEGGNLTNRFKPQGSFSTTALFSQDDDLFYTCRMLRAGFRVWQHFPEQVVGFGPRWVPLDGTVEQTIDSPFYLAWTHGHTNVVLPTKGAWLHRKYYQMFFKPSLAQMRDMIDNNKTAEDFAMALLVARATKKPPVALVLHAKDLATNLPCGKGLTSDGNRSSRDSRAPLFKALLNKFNNGLYPTTDFIDPLRVPQEPGSLRLEEPSAWKVEPKYYLPV